MSRHKPRSDTKPIALLNSPCYLPNTKHEPVHFISSLHVRGSTLCYVPQYYYSQPKTYIPIPTPTFFPSCWEKLFSCKTFPSSNSNTHKSLSWSPEWLWEQADRHELEPASGYASSQLPGLLLLVPRFFSDSVTRFN